MSLDLVERLNFEKMLPVDGSYLIMNVPRSGPNNVFDPTNSFLHFLASNLDAEGLTVDHSCDTFS